MLEWMNGRLSIAGRVFLVVVCAAPAVALLLTLFVQQNLRGAALIEEEREGLAYVSEIWPALANDQAPPATFTARAQDFQAAAEARAFLAAHGADRQAAGAALMRAVADGSHLTLDADLGSFYAMDAATTSLPRLMAVISLMGEQSARGDRFVDLGRVSSLERRTLQDLGEAVHYDSVGVPHGSVMAARQRLLAALARLDARPDSADARAGALACIDQVWRADNELLSRMLDARLRKVRTVFLTDLGMIALALGAAAAFSLIAMRGLSRRLRALWQAMDRLNAGDTSVEIPFQADRNETGRIAAALVALKKGLVEAEAERRRVAAANAAVRESEARYRMLSENTTDMILRGALDGRIEYSSAAVRQLGFEPGELLGRPVLELFHPEDRPELVRRRDAVLLGEHPAAVASRVQRADGEWIWVESSLAPIHGEDGQVTALVGVLRDVSERRSAQAALQEVNAELRRVARASALGAFAASLAHEINQPLAAAVIDAEAALRWLDHEPLELARAGRAIDRTLADVRRASEVVKRLRALVTKDEPAVVEFDVDEAIVEVLALTERERHRSQVAAVHQAASSPCRIRADRIQFQQVILNLVLNAIEAMRETPADARRLAISTRPAEDASVEVAVEDSGPGVSEALAASIFDSLFTTKLGGTGLGLSISRSIVEAHGGRIWVEAAHVRGAVFKVWLPRGGVADADASGAPAQEEAAV
jgi:PAS domain S-box-containing protein